MKFWSGKNAVSKKISIQKNYGSKKKVDKIFFYSDGGGIIKGPPLKLWDNLLTEMKPKCSPLVGGVSSILDQAD